MQLNRCRHARLAAPPARLCKKVPQRCAIRRLATLGLVAAMMYLWAPGSFAVRAQGQGGGVAENNLGARKHLDFAGKPCLESTGTSRPLASNPHILNHAVLLQNHCIEKIKVKVCYYRTDECTDVEIPPHASREQIIGVFPAMQLFRYEVKEQF